eukprot:CAMPEP_0170548674 /NCGR_PEP_ID=MMETSP0211-20121228/6915_1 /TAXON_ID=311385 /ORGANISM="Pseudokeronopsis sp., Strain OXSARD2" /LENGTH=46 /DNA_ID= /DNA_START= /DNA_END= /DNA_ORIENTATION=
MKILNRVNLEGLENINPNSSQMLIQENDLLKKDYENFKKKMQGDIF